MLVIFDVEGVLVDGELLPELAKKVDRENEVYELTMKGIKGEIIWEDGLFQRLALIRGCLQQDCIDVANSLPLMNGARALLRTLKNEGWKTVAVSGGFSLLSDRVRDELGLDYAIANEFFFKDGKLDGTSFHVKSNKAEALTSLLATLQEPKENIVAVVDGANDLNLFEIAGKKIAFNAQPIVEHQANYIVKEKNLTDIIPILGLNTPSQDYDSQLPTIPKHDPTVRKVST